MFVRPRTWVNGESGIRSDSLNKSLPYNLDAVRSLFLRRVGVSTKTNESVTLQRKSADQIYTVSSLVDFPNSAVADQTVNVFGGTSYSTVNTQYPAGVLWVPFANLQQAKKTWEKIYFQVTVRAFFAPMYNDQYSVNWSRIEYDYMGSSLDASTPSTAIANVSWSPTLSKTTSQYLVLMTAKTEFDTSLMVGGTNPEIAAFRFRMRQYGIPLSSSPATGYATDTISSLRIRVELFVE